MAILKYPFNLDDHFHYQKRYRYYQLLKDYENEEINWGEFVGRFNAIYKETNKIIYSTDRHSEEFKSLNFTSKSKKFERLIHRIWCDIYEPDMPDGIWNEFNLTEEEIEEQGDIYIRESLKRISKEMEAYLDS